jgi:bifunctional non-homologous end joining protein LigD
MRSNGTATGSALSLTPARPRCVQDAAMIGATSSSLSPPLRQRCPATTRLSTARRLYSTPEGAQAFRRYGLDLGGGRAALLYAFDCLFLGGRDLRRLPLSDRRQALERLIGRPKSGAILFSDEFEGDGADFFKLAGAHELEGIVSKRVDLPYRSSRSQDWLKVKCVQSDAFIIIGYQPDGRGGIANLKLAIEDNGALRYAGAVGSGFSEATMRMLRKVLDPLAQNRSAVASLKVKGWVRPGLYANVAYRGFTTAGELRHASFKGLRDDE